MRVRKGDWIVIDEIQRVPDLLNEVHDLIESKGRVFILTGSSARKLRRDSVNLLAGRALTYHMHPLTVREQGEAFRLEESLRYGHLPARFSEQDPAKYLRDYVQTYLREEVMQEGLTRNAGQFSRFLEVASFSQGSLINVSEIARDARIQRAVAESYFSILEDLLIGVRLPVFSRRAKRKLIHHGKFFYFDAGVYRAIRPAGPLDSPAEIDGPALEIKRSATVNPSDTKALREFKKDYPEAFCFLLYGGTQPLFLGDIRVVPIREGLRGLAELLLTEPRHEDQ